MTVPLPLFVVSLVFSVLVALVAFAYLLKFWLRLIAERPREFGAFLAQMFEVIEARRARGEIVPPVPCPCKGRGFL
jgi:hypothetical protein